MNKIEKLIPFALDSAKKFIETDSVQHSIPKQFKGYISSFGASIIQAGLLPTLAFYSDANKAKGDRSMLIPALIWILDKNKNLKPDESVITALDIIVKDEKKLPDQMNILFNWLLKQNSEMLRKELMDAAIALKLALRTFKEIDIKKNE